MRIFEILKKQKFVVDASDGKVLIYLRKGETLPCNIDTKNVSIIIVDVENKKLIYGKV